MAREYARIMTTIWRNAEFRQLSEAQQRAYLFLVTQPDISAAGVLALRLRRWADMSSTSTPESLAEVLKRLEAGRFIVVDWDAEELLIRSFIRWDGGFNNPKRRPVIVRAAEEVDSPAIVRHLAAEFERCGIPTPPDWPPGGTHPAVSDRAPDSLSPTHSKIDRADPGPEPFPQVNRLSDREAASDGVVVTYLSGTDTTTHNPQTVPPTAGDDAPPTAQTLVGEWLDGCRKRPPNAVIGHASKAIKALLEEGIDPSDIREGIQAWAAKSLHPSALPSVVNEVMNRQAAPRRSRTSEAVASVDVAFDEWEARHNVGGNVFLLSAAQPEIGA